jgi:hypothetical protein
MLAFTLILHVVLHKQNVEHTFNVWNNRRYTYSDDCQEAAQRAANDLQARAKWRLNFANVDVKWACSRVPTIPL